MTGSGTSGARGMGTTGAGVGLWTGAGVGLGTGARVVGGGGGGGGEGNPGGRVAAAGRTDGVAPFKGAKQRPQEVLAGWFSVPQSGHRSMGRMY
jgi:hypothetical protein